MLYTEFTVGYFRYNDMGTIVIGKVESGGAKKGETLLIMPNKVSIG